MIGKAITSGSAGGRRKRTSTPGTSLAAYPTRRRATVPSCARSAFP
jgi:hypothetical protein